MVVLLAPVGGSNDEASPPAAAAVATHVWAQVSPVKDGQLHQVLVVAAILTDRHLWIFDRLPVNVLADKKMKVFYRLNTLKLLISMTACFYFFKFYPFLRLGQKNVQNLVGCLEYGKP